MFVPFSPFPLLSHTRSLFLPFPRATRVICSLRSSLSFSLMRPTPILSSPRNKPNIKRPREQCYQLLCLPTFVKLMELYFSSKKNFAMWSPTPLNTWPFAHDAHSQDRI